MKYGYARVSTKSQDLTEQVEQLRKLGAEEIVSEQVSGAVEAGQRNGFGRLMKKIQEGDELIVTKLDRLGRSGVDILSTIQTLQSKGVVVTIDGVGTMRQDVMGRLMQGMLAAFADFERGMIVERMQGGRKASMSRGVKMGRKDKLSKSARDSIRRRRQEGEGSSVLAREYGVSRRTVTRVCDAA